MRRGIEEKMKNTTAVFVIVLLLGFCSSSLAVESGMYRLLSISKSEKLILVSQIPNKKKYLLDVASAKITVNGKPAEFDQLEQFSILNVKLELNKSSRNGIDIDGSAIEIRISDPDRPNQ
jgi:hypothetical protein